MSFTGTQVLTAVDDFFNDSTNQLWGSSRKLSAINSAIDNAWPILKDQKIDSSVTLDSQTFEYSPTAGVTTTAGLATLEEGFADAVYVVPWSTTSEAKVRLQGVTQRLSGTTWTLIVSPYLAMEFNTKVLHVGYNARVGRIATSTDSIELPMAYLENYVKYWLLAAQALTEPRFDARIYADMMPEWRNQYQTALQANRRGYVNRMPMTYDHGGASVVTEPISQVNSVRV